MRRSLMREKLKRGEYVVMTQSWIVPYWKMVDMMGFVGFDGVWLENEHSDFSYGELSQMILAARAHDMDSIVRVARTGYTGIIKPLEAGATGIIVPHCMGGEDARSIVRDARFSPMGLRGSGGSSDSDYGTSDRKEYIKHANTEILIAVIIEDKEAVDDVDAIAGTEGIDILLLGPVDLFQLKHPLRRLVPFLDNRLHCNSQPLAACQAFRSLNISFIRRYPPTTTAWSFSP